MTRVLIKTVKVMCVIAMAGLLLFPGCKKSDDTAQSLLHHTWEWVRTEGGIGSMSITPDSAGYSQKLKFDENGRYTRYKNNLVISSGNYTVISAESILDGQVYDMVIFDDRPMNVAIYRLTKYELILRDDVFDCYAYTYER